MHRNALTLIFAGALLSLLVNSATMSQEHDTSQGQKRQHHRYRLIDLGTLGGPNSSPAEAFFDGTTAQSISRGGIFAGLADTSAPDPFSPDCPDCFVIHAIRWSDGRLTDLGTLPGPADLSSVATSISNNGVISGASLNGVNDPFNGLPSVHGVIWKHGQIFDLGALKGGYESVANGVNNRGEVVGFASNAIFDPNSLLGFGSQTRAVVWRSGTIHDLGTLGGTDAVALYVNELGHIVGQSYTADSVPPPSSACGDQPLTLHGFFWENGKMVDLKTLGGRCTFAYALNNRAQVVGQSTVAGDQTSHPYLWEKGTMTDLGTLGGDYGFAVWLNDSGDVVGSATNEGDQALLSFLWKDGQMSKLESLHGDACSAANAINSKGQVVGGSGFFLAPFFPACTDTAEHAVVWENGRALDLNSLVAVATDLTLTEATFINDKGEISGFGTLPDGDSFTTHAFLLLPCNENHDGMRECEDAGPETLRMQSEATPSDASRAHQNRPFPKALKSPFSVRPPLRPRLSVPRPPSAPYQLTSSALNTYQLRLDWQEATSQSLSGFNIYRCNGCANPKSLATKIASVGPGVRTYNDGSISNPLSETKNYTYEIRAFSGSAESGPSNPSSASTEPEPFPTNLTSFAFKRGSDDVVRLGWTDNSTDEDSYYVENCVGSTCTNFSQIAQLAANATNYVQGFRFSAGRMITVRYRVRAHSPGGYSGYSNIRTQTLP
jgi:probable HAF family extracellular repeat protein